MGRSDQRRPGRAWRRQRGRMGRVDTAARVAQAQLRRCAPGTSRDLGPEPSQRSAPPHGLSMAGLIMVTRIWLIAATQLQHAPRQSRCACASSTTSWWREHLAAGDRGAAGTPPLGSLMSPVGRAPDGLMARDRRCGDSPGRVRGAADPRGALCVLPGQPRRVQDAGRMVLLSASSTTATREIQQAVLRNLIAGEVRPYLYVGAAWIAPVAIHSCKTNFGLCRSARADRRP